MSTTNAVNTGLKVLIIDDDEFISARLKSIIEKLQCQAQCIFDGNELGGALVSYKPDVIFLDLILPGMDGVQIIEVLAKAKCQAKIVLMSGLDQRTLASVKDMAKSQQLDVVDTLNKPILPEAVAKIISPIKGKDTAPQSKPLTKKGYGLDLLLEPELPLQESASNVTCCRANLIWCLDDGQTQELGLLFDKSQSRNTAKGSLTLLLDQIAQLQASLAAKDKKASFKVPLFEALLADRSTPEFIDDLLNSKGLDRNNISFEFSDVDLESVLKSDTAMLSRMKIKSIKLGISVRQSGDATVALLNKLPVDEVLLDMADARFSDSQLSRSETEFEVASLVSFAKRLGLSYAVKNVSSATQLAFARRCNFEFGSGRAVQLPGRVTDIFKL